MRVFTAVFGDEYEVFLRGLLRSAKEYAPNTEIEVLRIEDVDSLVRYFPEQYHEGTNRCVFKFPLFLYVQLAHPGEDVCWIDCDMLLLDDLEPHFKPGVLNVVAHGRRFEKESIQLGKVAIEPERYAIGGLYSVPPGDALGILEKEAISAAGEHDTLRRCCGDMAALNRVIAKGLVPVHYVTDNREHIFNFETQTTTMHPSPFNYSLKEITDGPNGWHFRGRRISVFPWTANSLRQQMQQRFWVFSPPVREKLIAYYA